MNFFIKDPVSALTHFIAFILAVCAAAPLLMVASVRGSRMSVIALLIFAISMMLLYSASTIYHTLNISIRWNQILRKIDHMMIYVLIAGSYTPICLITLHYSVGYPLLALVWGVAILGILINAFWITCPRWFSSLIYIAMGWLCVFAMVPLVRSLPSAALFWLVLGGILYTVGGIIYASKPSILKDRFRYFGFHELFHIFVMLGSLCHYVTMFCIILA
jgi:hemolysin III